MKLEGKNLSVIKLLVSVVLNVIVTAVTVISLGMKIHKDILNDVTTQQQKAILDLQEKLTIEINNKLNKEQVIEIRGYLIDGKSTIEIAQIYNISKATIQNIKEGKTWQSLGGFKIKGKASRLKQKDLEKLYQLFELKVKVKDIQKILPYCIGTIAKQRKIWKQMKKE